MRKLKPLMYIVPALFLGLGFSCKENKHDKPTDRNQAYFQKNWTVVGYRLTEQTPGGVIINSNDIAVRPYSYFYFIDNKVFCESALLSGQGTVTYGEGTLRITLTNMGSIPFTYTITDQNQAVLVFEEVFPGMNTIVHRLTLSRTAF